MDFEILFFCTRENFTFHLLSRFLHVFALLFIFSLLFFWKTRKFSYEDLIFAQLLDHKLWEIIFANIYEILFNIFFFRLNVERKINYFRAFFKQFFKTSFSDLNIRNEHKISQPARVCVSNISQFHKNHTKFKFLLSSHLYTRVLHPTYSQPRRDEKFQF